MKFLYAALLATWSFWAGATVHEYFHGSVHVYHNVDEGTALNHGQASIECTFPSGVTANHIKMPNGEIYPRPGGMRWVEVLPDGRQKTWLDRLSFEVVE